MTSKPHLILTVDYELFGDGSGCLDACVLRPAERMMRTAERFNAPLTFFAEALEFIALAEQANDRRAQDQLSAALARGHDAQLHLHPQWWNAHIDSCGSWCMDMSRWRIGDLPEEEVQALVRQGRQWLESEVAANSPGYRCLAFRAGGWCIQPSDSSIAALLADGFAIDSTVAPGQWRVGHGEWSDFRNATDLPFWRTAGDVCHPATEGLWEVPIAVGNIGRWRHFKSLLMTKKRGAGGMAPGCVGSYRGPVKNRWNTLRAKTARLQQLGSAMLDLSTLTVEDLITVTDQWLARHKGVHGLPIPVVAIAHTKNFTPASERALEGYLKWAQGEGMVFSTYSGWLSSFAK